MTTTTKYAQRWYYCPLCHHEQMVGTNHQGEIYSGCKKCGGMVLYCKEANQFFGVEYVYATLRGYNFNIESKHFRAAYESLSSSLIADGRTCHRCLIKHETAEAEQQRARGGWIKLYKPFQWADQFVSCMGRVHLWKEYAFPNNAIRQGYFIEITKNEGKD